MVISRLALFAASASLVAAACPPDPAPEPAPAPAASAATHRTVSAWLPYWDQEGAYRDALRHARQLHTVSPFWYQAKSAARIDGHPGAGDRRIVDGLHRAGIKVVPTVMETLGPGVLAAILTSPAKRATHIRALAALARTRGYDGIDIDYETIAPTPTAKYRTVRAGYASFVTALCKALHARHKQCIITVSPQTAATGRIWNYPVIGRAADRVRIMAYNLHWEGGPSGPLSGERWYEEILRRATALIPRRKIEMALPAYGWDWRADGKGRAKHVTWKEAEALRRKKHAPYRLDPASRTPHFTYKQGKVKRTVWYQDARGVAGHLPALRKYGVANTGLWALNFEDPALWKVLARG
ncbi:glycosyl hydrolase family 18 protein [Streptomyces sp. NBC_01465]|uniref:glycosyl hydrolase family 18 protein n=1 Tax=Streptomyces sp. NBC_01465 TaxID=2903878 RepID=UPI002E328DF1|nr:glycosyl hydrolase family 18 protein [Streptomyces sp. NBC_01465]